MNVMNVYLFDEHTELREQLQNSLQNCSGIRICGSCGSLEEVLVQIDLLRPDVILYEVKMANRRGIEIFKQIRERFRDQKLIVATSYADGTEKRQVMTLGADGYWDRQQGVAALCELILS